MYHNPMSKKTPPPDDSLFRQTMNKMKNIKPLKHSSKLPISKTKMPIEQIEKKQHRAEYFKHKHDFLDYSAGHDAYTTIHGDASMEFKRCTLPTKCLKQLKQGQIEVEATLDLHSYTVSEAAEQLRLFMQECLRRKLYCIHIIHGKGQMGDIEKPVLKNFVNDYLRQQKNVLAFHSARLKDGGTGAVYVLLAIHS